MIYWRCVKCEVIEISSHYVVSIYHDHEGQIGTWRYSLMVCRTKAEARGLIVVKRRNRTGFRKPSKRRKGGGR